MLAAFGLVFASPSAAATISTYTREGFKFFLNGVDETFQTFEGFANGTPVSAIDGVTYATTGSEGVYITDTAKSSSGTNSLASLVRTSTTQFFAFANDQKVTFTFASNIAAFAIDINTFLESADGSKGLFTATFNTAGVPSVVTSLFDPFGTARLPGSDPLNPTRIPVGQFIGFSSDTPFNSVTIAGLPTNPALKTFTLDTLITAPYVEPEEPEEPTPSEVPLPLPLPMLAVAFTGFWFVRRRKAA